MKKISSLFVAAAAFALFASAPASAATATSANQASKSAACRDTKGKFIPCPKPTASTSGQRCRDTKGKFIKCPASTGMAVNTTAKTNATTKTH
ncbi:MAG: hypothetical protein JWQ97_1344 [Phenylobacterium sp.]|nr:hypothetical protein [Phenylobacterium sp.]